jgi:hypothetical protein
MESDGNGIFAKPSKKRVRPRPKLRANIKRVCMCMYAETRNERISPKTTNQEIQSKKRRGDDKDRSS